MEVGSGLNDIELGGRLRYKIAREFAPYVGVVWEKRFGQTVDTDGHSGLVQWELETTKDRSIRARGDEVPKPPAFDSALVVSGFDGFRDMCVQCHGAPGVDPGVNGQGLYPEPPELGEEAHEFTDGELFWITKHGVKLTGMPAFGPTHADRDLWAVVAFIRELEEMTPEEYQRRVAEREAELEAQGFSGGHSHAPGTPEHEH